MLLAVLVACGGAPTTPTGTTTGSTTTDQPGDDDDDVTSPPTCGDIDADGDGVFSCDDCDDDDPDTYPGAEERCDGLDNDCDGEPHPEELTLACEDCDEAGWWHATRDVQGGALEDLLGQLSAPQDCSSYESAREYLFLGLDNDAGWIECVYTGRTLQIGSALPDWNEMNTEHSWPQSLGADQVPARCDLHHLYITDSDTNSTRGNLPFGEVVSDTQSIDGEARLGDDPSGQTVFEPPDAHKGNVARSMLYFAARYGYDLTTSEVALYQSWSALDPVDVDELDRTWAIAEEQVLPNPYVVCDWLVDAL